MFQRELMFIYVVASTVFLLVAGAGWFAIRQLHETSRMLVVDTLPGLVNAGLVEQRIHDNRHLMRETLLPHTPTERAQIIQQIQTNSTDDLWKNYAASIFEPTDRQNYTTILLAQSNYLQICQSLFALVTAGKIEEATELFNGNLSDSFQSYNAGIKNLFDYNMRQGNARGQIILKTSRFAPLAIGALCVLIFLFGLVLGLRSGLSGTK